MADTPDFRNEPLPPIEAYEIVGDELIVPLDYTLTQECMEKLFSCGNRESFEI